jgi:hypothetical protein
VSMGENLGKGLMDFEDLGPLQQKDALRSSM